MWLTGFDAPSLHTMYLDKPMQGHGLMQAIARVNRVFRDKPGGLVVDYLGLADELKERSQPTPQSGGTGETAIDQAEAVALMLEKYEVCCDLFHGFDWSIWMTRHGHRSGCRLLPAAQEHILAQADGKARLMQAVQELSHAFALAVPHDEAMRIRDDVGFFQAVRAVLAKSSGRGARPEDELDYRDPADRLEGDRVRRRRRHLRGGGPEEAGHLDPVRRVSRRGARTCHSGTWQSNCCEKLLKGEIKTRSKRNVVQARSFAEMLELSLRRYQNRAIEAAQVIEELIQLAKDMREAEQRGEELGLTEDELAFYDALETNDSAVKVLGDDDSADHRPGAGRRRCATTSPSTGRCARTCGRTCACW